MNWNADNDTDRQALKSIAQMLVAMAALADCSCGRSALVRRLVLWFLRPAETCAWDFVSREMQARGMAMPDLPAAMSAGDSVADAMRLATLFRALALMLQHLPTSFDYVAHWSVCAELSLGGQAHSMLDRARRAAARRPPAYDTS